MPQTTLNRVPHVIFIYWVIKIASTTLGETGADMISMTMNVGYGATILIFLAAFGLFLGVKLAMKRYDPTVYWLLFTSTAIAGTAISDYIDRTLGIGYAGGSVLLLVLLGAILLMWKRTQHSLSVEHISTNASEVLYWLAFLVANTLGTAAGDFLADELGIGFLVSSLVLSGVLIILAGLHYLTKANGICLFWFAFVLTRPFGATFGDFLTKPLSEGGLDLGTIGSSVFFGMVLILAIWIENQLERGRLQQKGSTVNA